PSPTTTDPPDAGSPAERPEDPALTARREMLGKVCIGLGVAGGVALGVPMVGFVVGPLLKKPPKDESEWKPVTQEFYWREPKDAPGSNDFQWRAAPHAPPPRTIQVDSLAIGETRPGKFPRLSVPAPARVTRFAPGP